jgi:hypothetical protein
MGTAPSSIHWPVDLVLPCPPLLLEGKERNGTSLFLSLTLSSTGQCLCVSKRMHTAGGGTTTRTPFPSPLSPLPLSLLRCIALQSDDRRRFLVPLLSWTRRPTLLQNEGSVSFLVYLS